ncbi:MAG TPA: branched-chain amino acid aminotransferase [Propionibacteriaceae bacterium]|nr:branched-chain amino acid aminotransferase [Propionibacteriaceae bacterium]HPZ49599.1 branched-chain amino acid aminotransferase [Propionibacteriaceae bacterium]HQE30679.1 branched-chain amino acid aminotransferase [Propionibacteriaceae bacterium]
MSRFTVTPSPHPTSVEARAAAVAHPVLGKDYGDHMARATWTAERGWHDLSIEAVQPLQMHPAAGVFHYAQEIFEGMKAYRRPDGGVNLFRPEKNAARFAQSAVRMSMPPLPVEDFVDSVTDLVALDQAWVPDAEGEQSLYIRPFMIADETFLGVRAAKRYTYAVVTTPAGPYYPDPVKLWVTPSYTRAAPGGTGAAKCGGNYAASLAAAAEAQQHGCGQVLWLDGAEHRWVEECGTMNILFVTRDGDLVTPALSGTILDGVTRDSILTIAPEVGLRTVERKVEFAEVLAGVREGAIAEVLACGTAAVITPISGFATPEGDDVMVGDGAAGEQTRALRNRLLDIQYGRADDPYGWTHQVA